MNTKVKYLLGGIIFLLCVCIGFILTKSAKSVMSDDEIVASQDESETINQDENIDSVSVGAVSHVAGSISRDTLSDGDNLQSSTIQDETDMKELEITSTEVRKTGDTYSLKITCSNMPANISLIYEIPDLGLKNSDGYFTQIPGRKSGSYNVNVINNSTGEVLASKKVTGFKLAVEQMSSGEFQSLLLNQSDNSLLGGKHPKVAKSVALSFEGLKEDERKPRDILDIRIKIANGLWSSAKVIRVGYDEKGRINSARIQPVY